MPASACPRAPRRGSPSPAPVHRGAGCCRHATPDPRRVRAPPDPTTVAALLLHQGSQLLSRAGSGAALCFASSQPPAPPTWRRLTRRRRTPRRSRPPPLPPQPIPRRTAERHRPPLRLLPGRYLPLLLRGAPRLPHRPASAHAAAVGAQAEAPPEVAVSRANPASRAHRQPPTPSPDEGPGSGLCVP
ncbi:hypothetical protein BS78_05G203600 [Paspalum vaginatum]|nr:hypothetical protein BS78_05G203600 [Paspalum vaginatum]